MKRHYGIDLLRIVCSLAVVIIHIVTAPVAMSKTIADRAVLETLELVHNLLKWSVPCFFIITGYCQCQKEACSYTYCFSHIKKYLLCLITIGFIQALLEGIYNTKSISLPVVGNAILNVIEGNIWDHMWFVYSIIGIYLVMPVLHGFIISSNVNARILTGILFIFTVLCPSLERWLQLGIILPFGGYLFYVCIGGVIARYPLSKKTIALCYALGIASFAVIVADIFKTQIGYMNPAVCLMSLSVFLVFNQMRKETYTFVSYMTQYTWGMYLLHPFIINIALKLLKVDVLSTSPYGNLLLLSIVTIVGTFGITHVLKKMPVFKSIL